MNTQGDMYYKQERCQIILIFLRILIPMPNHKHELINVRLPDNGELSQWLLFLGNKALFSVYTWKIFKNNTFNHKKDSSFWLTEGHEEICA